MIELAEHGVNKSPATFSHEQAMTGTMAVARDNDKQSVATMIINLFVREVNQTNAFSLRSKLIQSYQSLKKSTRQSA